jgi:ribonuclease HI
MSEKQLMPIILSKNTNKNKITSKIFPTTEYVLYFDGCSKGNPGPSGIGAVIYNNKKEIWASYKYIGDERTNNEAEYSALILGLEQAIKLKIDTLSVCGDSLLVINQVNGVYKVKNPNLLMLYEKVLLHKQSFTYIDFNHVYRNNNKRADELSNLAITTNTTNTSQQIEFKSELTVDTDVNVNVNVLPDIIEMNEDWNQEGIIKNLLQKTTFPSLKLNKF